MTRRAGRSDGDATRGPGAARHQAGQRPDLKFDVYGRFVVVLRDVGGVWWEAARVDSDGKRRRLPEVLVPTESDPGEIVDHLEAAYHEWARPGRSITRLDR